MRNHDNSVSNLDEGLLSALINFRKAEPNTDSFFLIIVSYHAAKLKEPLGWIL